MGKIKDIFYNISDVLVAFCIVGIAGLVIWFSIGNIMEYPSIVSAAAQQNEENANFGLAIPVSSNNTDESTLTSSAINSESTTDSGIEDNTTTDSGIEIYSIYINYGESTSTIAKKFVDAGLFDSIEQFNTLLTQMNAESAIKSGNFIIAANKTPEEVITQITTTSGL